MVYVERLCGVQYIKLHSRRGSVPQLPPTQRLNRRRRGRRMECSSGVGTPRSILEEEIRTLEAEKARIDARLTLLRSQVAAQIKPPHHEIRVEVRNNGDHHGPVACPLPCRREEHGLSKDMIFRYSRHLLLPQFGVKGQFNLSKSSILVIGAGGLGSPVAMYLAACGTGCVGIVDNDIVELNNLQRQIIHTEAYVGRPKVESAASVCRAINSTTKVVEYKEAFVAENAIDIVSKYDVVVDATDNVPTRYLINDCCVLLNKPLVSGAALGFEGQLTVYNHAGGPCHRCLFPTPPPATACQRCSDSGVLGVVPGVIGSLQALEAIKIASAVGEPLSERMLLFDAFSGRIRMVKIRGRSSHCDVCSENPKLTLQLLRSFDYESFTKSPISDRAPKNLRLLPDTSRITSEEYKARVESGEPHVLVDVRPPHHFEIASLPNAVNIPLSTLESDISAIDLAMKKAKKLAGCLQTSSLYVICRRGNDSQRAVRILNENGYIMAKDIVGGLESWTQEVNPDFPIY